jgi:hypothetical protein
MLEIDGGLFFAATLNISPVASELSSEAYYPYSGRLKKVTPTLFLQSLLLTL